MPMAEVKKPLISHISMEHRLAVYVEVGINKISQGGEKRAYRYISVIEV
jgi:hypothetical protein